MSPIATRLAAVCLALSAALTACGDAAGPLDDRQVDDLGAALHDEVEATVGAFTLRGILLPFSERHIPGPSARPSAGLAPLPLCASGSPGIGSSDGDPVPDSVVFTFTVPPCSYTGVRDGRLELSGMVEIVDPAPQVTGFEYVATLTDLAYRYVAPELERNYTVVRNGSRTREGGAAAVIVAADLEIVRRLAVFDVVVTEDWTATFTPASATIALDQPLPDGTVTIEGTMDWSGPGEAFGLTISTPTPLAYDADCTDTPQRIRAGELRAAGTFEGENGYLRLTWNDCGDEPEIRFVAAAE